MGSEVAVALVRVREVVQDQRGPGQGRVVRLIRTNSLAVGRDREQEAHLTQAAEEVERSIPTSLQMAVAHQGTLIRTP